MPSPLHNSFEAPLATSVGGPSSWATDQDWIRHRSLICRMYKEKPLQEVMNIMKSEHGFKSTIKIYKTRITHWGLDKKNKDPEMRAIVRKFKQRADQGKRSVIHVRNRSLDYRDVLRYFERKRLSIDDVATQTSGALTPEAVNMSTPPRSPLAMPEQLATPERMLVCIRDYFAGSFESGAWFATACDKFCQSTKTRGDAYISPPELIEHCEAACVLFDRNSFQDGGQVLISATSEIKDIILAENSLTLDDLFETIFILLLRRRYEIALAILEHFNALGELLLGAGHPMSCISKWLTSIPPCFLMELITRCSQSIGDHFEKAVGPMNYFTLISRMRFIRYVSDKASMGQGTSPLQDLLLQCEAQLGNLDLRTLSVLAVLSHQHLSNGNHAEAIKMGSMMVENAQSCPQAHYGLDFHAQGLFIMACSQYALGDTDSAEMNLRRAIKMSWYQHGFHDERAFFWCITLEMWLVEKGQPSSAAQMQSWRKQQSESRDTARTSSQV